MVVSDVMVEVEGRSRRIGGDVRKCMAGIQSGVRRRLMICRYIWPHMLAMALTYTVTLSLYPGVETLIQSCSLAHWITIILMVTFNITDLVGKVMAGLCSSWSRVSLVLGPLARICLVPLLLVPRGSISEDVPFPCAACMRGAPGVGGVGAMLR